MFQKNKRNWLRTGVVFSAVLLLLAVTAFGAEGEAVEHTSKMYATIWALVPPAVAIVLALITKEVFSSLFIGIVTGCLFYSNFNIKEAFLVMITDQTSGGFLANITDPGNGGIIIFLIVLGVLVALMNKAG